MASGTESGRELASDHFRNDIAAPLDEIDLQAEASIIFIKVAFCCRILS